MHLNTPHFRFICHTVNVTVKCLVRRQLLCSSWPLLCRSPQLLILRFSMQCREQARAGMEGLRTLWVMVIKTRGCELFMCTCYRTIPSWRTARNTLICLFKEKDHPRKLLSICSSSCLINNCWVLRCYDLLQDPEEQLCKLHIAG